MRFLFSPFSGQIDRHNRTLYLGHDSRKTDDIIHIVLISFIRMARA